MLAELYRRYRVPLLAAMRRACPAFENEDVVQETFIRLQRARDTYRLGEPVRPWLWTIAHNVRKDLARREARRPDVRGRAPIAATAADATHRPLEHAENVALLGRAIGELTPMLREVTVSHWLAESDFDEIAEASGRRPGTIRVRAHRACLRLRAILMRNQQATWRLPRARRVSGSR